MELPAVEPLLQQLTESLRQRLATEAITDPRMVGIHTGGAWIARYLHQQLALTQPLGTLDISFYRDDFSQIGMHPQVKPSHLPFDVDGHTIVLVDDVLHTGRTIRAALNELFDYGRPAAVLLLVLVDRGGRELPIQADIHAVQLDPGVGYHLKLLGPEPLRLALQAGQSS